MRTHSMRDPKSNIYDVMKMATLVQVPPLFGVVGRLAVILA